MARHAIAEVAWEMFRPSTGSGGAAVYDYGCDNEQLLEQVADGGTLWLSTNRQKPQQQRRYSLAYKLVNCMRIAPEESIFSGKWKYVVRARDWRQSRHFGYNDATDTLHRLVFTSGEPMSAVPDMSHRLQDIPGLTEGDVTHLERLQHKIEYGRKVFISYSREDALLAEEIESELEKRDISVSRDVAFLQPGQEWEKAIRQELESTDCFLVMMSPASAASKHVRDEVRWAVAEYQAGGLVKSILPIVLFEECRKKFPELSKFERWTFPDPEHSREGFDRLATGIAPTPR